MALRCLGRLKNVGHSIFRCPEALSVAQHRRFSVISRRNENFSPHLNSINLLQVRTKYDKKKANTSKEDEVVESLKESDSDDEDLEDKKTTVRVTVQSMRADLLLKTGIGMARNKIEAAFYENKIRINGKKIFKKSVSCSVGDTIDLQRSDPVANPNHQCVARIEILSTKAKEDSIVVTMRRFKTLIVEKNETQD